MEIDSKDIFLLVLGWLISKMLDNIVKWLGVLVLKDNKKLTNAKRKRKRHK